MSQLRFLEPIEVETAVENVSTLRKAPVVFEALWDGDSAGWRVEIWAIVEESSLKHPKYQEHFLISFPHSGPDWRLPKFQGLQSIGGAKATELTGILSAKFGIPVYFPSPDAARDECARWWDQSIGVPCQWCGVLLVQPEHLPCPWRGICYPCYLEKVREKR